MSEYAGYVKDLKTGAILGIMSKASLTEIERNNQLLIKKRDEHLIQFEVLSQKEGLEQFGNALGKTVVGKSKK
jgi:hypothetical protein